MSLVKLAIITKEDVEEYNNEFAKQLKKRKHKRYLYPIGGAIAGGVTLGALGLKFNNPGLVIPGIVSGAWAGHMTNHIKAHESMPKAIRTKIVPEKD